MPTSVPRGLPANRQRRFPRPLLHPSFFNPRQKLRGFRKYGRDDYLKKIFAEAKLTAEWKPETWYSMLSSGEVRSIRGTDRPRFRPLQQGTLLTRRGGQGHALDQEHRDPVGQGVRDQRIQLLPGPRQGDRYRNRTGRLVRRPRANLDL